MAGEPDQEPDIMQKVAAFLEAFEVTFADDWDHTKMCLDDNGFIRDDGDFINPGVADEGDNWANRGALLEAYSELSGAMEGQREKPELLDPKRFSPEQVESIRDGMPGYAVAGSFQQRPKG